MHNLNGTKNVCIISLLFLNVALVPYISSGPLSSFFVIAIIALLILSFFFLTRIFGSQKKSTTYISTILLGSLYLCLTAFFSASAPEWPNGARPDAERAQVGAEKAGYVTKDPKPRIGIFERIISNI